MLVNTAYQEKFLQKCMNNYVFKKKKKQRWLAMVIVRFWRGFSQFCVCVCGLPNYMIYHDSVCVRYIQEHKRVYGQILLSEIL